MIGYPREELAVKLGWWKVLAARERREVSHMTLGKGGRPKSLA